MSKSTGKWHFLNKDLLNQLIENIGEDIFSDTIFNIDTIETRIKHENNPKEREELIINTLNSFKDRFMRFYDFYTFPHTEIDYLKQRIKIRTIDVKVYFDNTNLLNTDADDLIITEIEDNVYEGEERNIIKLNSWEELMRIMGKKIEGHEYYCKYYHLESILTDIAIYTELRKRFSNDNATVSRLSPQQTETKAPTAPAIALFCNLINEAEIIKKENNEIPEIYCKHICENYNLKYTDRVRQNFNGNKSKKHYKELTELILPCIDEKTKDKIQKHLDSKNPPKQKLYA